jgi:outer membrane protein TolC
MIRPQMFPALLVAFSLVAQDAPNPDASHLTLQDAIETSLKNNLQVQISAQTRETAKANLQFSEGTFDWLLTSGLTLSHSKSVFENKTFSVGSTPLSGSSTTDYRNWTVGLSKPFMWGGSFQLNYNPTYTYTESDITGLPVRTTTTPYSGSFSASYTQSLLRNFGREASATSLIVAQYGSKAADYTFQLAIINQVASTESAYWDVVYAKRDLENKQQALAVAQQQLKENQIRVQVGTLAPIEVTSAEASVAQAEQNIIASEAQLLNAKDALIRILYPTSERPKGLETVDQPNVKPLQMDETKAVQTALENRVELKGAELDLASKKVLERAASNHTLPQLDLTVGYNGTASNYATFSPVNTDLAQAKNPGYSVGLQFALPIQNRAAKGNLSLARANRRSSELSLHDLQLGITLQVRQAFRNLDAASKGVTAAQKTRIYDEQDLDAERKKFENGMSTNFLVLSKLNTLDAARGAELQAQINYAKAVTALDQAIGRLLQARNLDVQ